ncbi:MAG TPA: zf-HC2 domain-containing protein [Gemmatimonadales bacterium]
MSDRWTDRLSEYLDGELPEGERVTLESHLQTCRECSEILMDLRRVIRRARTLKEQTPDRDLWPAIASRIGATPVASQAIEELASRRGGRRWTFSLPQLAAAGIALMVASGGAVWLLRPAPLTPNAAAPVTAAHPDAVPAINVAAKPSASQSYAAAVADLERVLAEGRGKLDSNTVKVIEQNLAAIDRAIAQAQRALEADSANLYLNTHLAETMRRKLDLLRQAAALVPVS